MVSQHIDTDSDLERMIILVDMDAYYAQVEMKRHGLDPEKPMAVQQWNASAKTWSLVSDFKPTDKDVINQLIAEDSSAYAKENNITPKCM